VIVWGDPRAVEGVKVTEQVPCTRSQLLDEKTPDPSLDQETVPDGLTPDTVAVTVVGAADGTVPGFSCTTVVVAGNGYPMTMKAPVRAETGMSPHIDVPGVTVIPVAATHPYPEK